MGEGCEEWGVSGGMSGVGEGCEWWERGEEWGVRGGGGVWSGELVLVGIETALHSHLSPPPTDMPTTPRPHQDKHTYTGVPTLLLQSTAQVHNFCKGNGRR